jgi:hypothetical protein
MQIHKSFASEMGLWHHIQAHFCPNMAINQKRCAGRRSKGRLLALVRVEGLEPPRFWRQNLNLVRLPIPPHPQRLTGSGPKRRVHSIGAAPKQSEIVFAKLASSRVKIPHVNFF